MTASPASQRDYLLFICLILGDKYAHKNLKCAQVRATDFELCDPSLILGLGIGFIKIVPCLDDRTFG